MVFIEKKLHPFYHRFLKTKEEIAKKKNLEKCIYPLVVGGADVVFSGYLAIHPPNHVWSR
jgi:hypothetical protein